MTSQIVLIGFALVLVVWACLRNFPSDLEMGLFSVAFVLILLAAAWFATADDRRNKREQYERDLAYDQLHGYGKPDYVLFSNDGPYGSVASENENVWNCDEFYWNDLNWLGGKEPISFYGFSFMIRFFPTPLFAWLVLWAALIAVSKDKAKRTMHAVLWTFGVLEVFLLTVLLGCLTDCIQDKAWWLCVAMRFGATTIIAGGCIVASLPDRVKGKYAP